MAVLVMSVAFRQIEPEPLKKFPAILFILIGFLILAEVVFWESLPKYENKGMLLRMWIGNRAGFIALALTAVVLLFPRKTTKFQFLLHENIRWCAIVVIPSIITCIALLIIRNLFRGTHLYYAMDCAMFAVFVLSISIVIAGSRWDLSRFRRSG
jgi:hypothetical protein